MLRRDTVSMREGIEELVFYCRQRLKELDEERAAIVAEVAEYQELLRGEIVAKEPWKIVKALEKHLGRLSTTWAAIFHRLSTYKHFNVRDVLLVASNLHRTHSRFRAQSEGNVRFQLSVYTKSGLVERVGGGRYRVGAKYSTSLSLLASHKPQQFGNTEIGPELAALAQERRVTPANPRPIRAQLERG
jgi:hypothetical protein